MGKRGHGYGSEDHLLRYRAERADEFDRLILATLDAPNGTLEWIYPTGAAGEREPEGLEFLSENQDVMTARAKFWPQSGRQQCWDGVAKFRQGESVEWILLEAKANAVEFVTSPCLASPHGGRKHIENAPAEVKRHLGVHRDYPWLATYYQYANPLAVLHFLNDMVLTPSRLLNIYFTR